MYTPVKFYYVKVGFKGVIIIYVCFRNVAGGLKESRLGFKENYHLLVAGVRRGGVLGKIYKVGAFCILLQTFPVW